MDYCSSRELFSLEKLRDLNSNHTIKNRTQKRFEKNRLPSKCARDLVEAVNGGLCRPSCSRNPTHFQALHETFACV